MERNLTSMDMPRLFKDGAEQGMFMNIVWLRDVAGALWQVVDDYPQTIELQFRRTSLKGNGEFVTMTPSKYQELFKGTLPMIIV